MIADLEKARQLAVSDHRLNGRFAYNIARISGVHTAICLIYFVGGYFGGADFGLTRFALLFGGIWAGNSLYMWLVFSGRTAHLREPVLTVPVALWLTATLLASAYFVDSFRVSVVMLFFMVMLLASFREGFLTLAGLALFAVVGYLVVVALAIRNKSMELQWSIEVLQWFIFTVTCIGFVMTGALIHRLRWRLSMKNEELAEALEEVREKAIRDELTGLFNRRHVMEVLEQQQALANSGDYGFSICYLDLDHFKPINDRYGHGVGDEVLTRFAGIARASLREADYIGRLGGEEFVLMLPNTDCAEAARVAERLRSALENTDFSDLVPELQVTVSAGLAQYRPGETLDTMMARADACLYEAKEAGRNRMVYAPEPEHPVDAVPGL